MKLTATLLVFSFLFFINSCNSPVSTKKSWIVPGEDDQKTVQTALINVKPGDTLFFGEGKFKFIGSISLDVDSVVLKGKGHDKTIFSFTEQMEGAEGVKVTSDYFTIEDIGIEDTKGDGLKVSESNGVIIRRVRMEWTNGADSSNGSYGLYPVSSKNILMEDCIARGASDAGVYVGQSENAVLRRNLVEGNVAGVEVENTINAEVYDNVARNNTAGIMIFDLPDLPKKNGKNVKIYNNKIINNNHPNFSKRGIAVYIVPAGTGLLLMACQHVEAYGNEITDNFTIGTAIARLMGTDDIMKRQQRDSLFDIYPSAIYLHDNVYNRSEGMPDTTRPFGKMLFEAFGANVPDIMFDGEISPVLATDGKLTGENRICICNNGDAAFINMATKSNSLDEHGCELKSLPSVVQQS